MFEIDACIGCCKKADKLGNIINEANEFENEMIILRNRIEEIAKRENLICLEISVLSLENQEETLGLIREEGSIEIMVPPFDYALLVVLPEGSKVIQQHTKTIENGIEEKKVIELPKGQKIIAKDFPGNKILNYIKLY
ncbi:MAG: hypothetical protein ACKKMV_02810 [Candidatus Nealsonbacteria bacterium]|nr:MAG: hypothetical protein IB617_02760 [Candidatus Nealsonbacteria bacterium]